MTGPFHSQVGEGTETEWFREHVWVSPRDLPGWETWAELKSIACLLLAHAKAGAEAGWGWLR